MAVSLRIPDSVKRRVAKLAGSQDRTVHAFMLDAIREKLESDEDRAAFYSEARRRLARMKKTGLAIEGSAVSAYLEGLARGDAPERPKARRRPQR